MSNPYVCVHSFSSQFQIKKLEEIVSQRQVVIRAKASREEAVEMASTLFAHGIFSSVVPSDYKARLMVTTSLLHWLASMANLSDGICRLVCEQVGELRLYFVDGERGNLNV